MGSAQAEEDKNVEKPVAVQLNKEELGTITKKKYELSLDYKGTSRHCENMIYISMIQLMLKRL